MSITNNNDGSNNNENNKKSKENLRELNYLIEEERLLADLKRKSEETLHKLKVEELTLLRFVRGLADASGDKPIMLADNGIQSTNNFNSTSSIISNGTNHMTTLNTNNSATSSQAVQSTAVQSTSIPSSTTVANTSTISSIEQNVNNTEVLKLNVDNILMTMNNDQENEEIEMDD